MRARLIALLVTLGALVGAGAALGAFSQRAATRLTTSQAGSSTGLSIAYTLSDPTTLGGKPRILRGVELSLPAGTRFGLGAIRHCTLTDTQLTTAFGPRCPRASRVGGGTAIANIAPMTPFTVGESVAAYVRDDHTIILMVTPRLPGASAIVMPITVSGSRLTLAVPRVVWQKIIHVAQVSLHLRLTAASAAPGALITAGRCTGGRFVIDQRFVYASDTPVVVRSVSSCR